MDKTTQLFIRACKSKDSYTRLRSVYRRFYLDDLNWEPHVVLILSRICDNYLNLSTIDIITGVSPHKDWMYPEELRDDYHYKALSYLSTVIAHTKIDNFEGLSRPRRFRGLI